MDEQMNREQSPSAQSRIHITLLVREVLRRLWAIVMVAVIAASCAYVGSGLLYSPQYQTSTTFVVSMRSGATSVYSNLNAAQGLAASFSQVLSSDVMSRRVAQTLGEDVEGQISARVISETNLLEMRVTAGSPRDAYLITCAVLDNYEELAGKILNSVSLDILQQPTVPTRPINSPNTRHNMKLAVLLAGAAAVGLICLMATLRDTVKTVSDVEDKLDGKLLAAIHYERKHKTLRSVLRRSRESILITRPTTGFAYVETIRKLRTRVSYQMRQEGFKTLMVTSVLENEGKSTVAANLALSLAQKGKRVLLIDADLRKPALHKIFDLQERKYATLIELLRGKASMGEALIQDAAPNLLLLLGRRGTERSTELTGGEDMKLMVEQVQKAVDVVILDTPPMTVSSDAEHIAALADAAILVVRQDAAPVTLINDMLDVLRGSRAKVLGCVLNYFRSTDLDDHFSYGSSGKYGYGKQYGYGKKYGADRDKRARRPEEDPE